MACSIRNTTSWADVVPIIGLDEAKQHLRIIDTSEDAMIPSLVMAAMDRVESYTGHVLTLREMEMVLDRFPSGRITISRTPILGVFGLTYEDTDGATVEIADFTWSAVAPDQVSIEGSWPRGARNVLVQFEAGYLAGQAPPALVTATKLYLPSLYERRPPTGDEQRAIDSFCDGYRAISL